MLLPSAPRRTERRRLPAVPLTLGLVVLGWLGASLGLRIVYDGRALPGTAVAGEAVGGADRAEVRSRAGRLPVPERTVVASGAGKSYTLTSRQVDLRIDTEATADRVLDAGRGGPLEFLAAPAVALGLGGEVAPAYAMDEAALERIAGAIARQVDVDPFRGGLSIDPSTLETSVEPSRSGRELDRRALSRTVAAALREGSPERVALPIRTVPGPSRRAVERVATQARAYLEEGPLRLTGAGSAIKLGTRRLARLLAVEPRPGGDPGAVQLGVDARAVEKAIARLAKQRDREPADARIEAPAAPVLLEDQGDVSWRPRDVPIDIRPGRKGRTIEREPAAEAVAEAVRERRHRVDLPVRREPPALATADARKVRSLIGTFTTRFACCEPRVTNIQLIAQAVDGTVIAPGQRFSLNEVAGPRTAERGFRKAPFIADGKLKKSVGGGVSQFSTTIYNAAFFAGLQLDAHQAHSFYIDRYPAGREATLNYGSIDLVWTNDTDAPVLVRTSATDTSVTVSLYGANGGRRVRAETGPRRPVADRDFAITVTRTVRYPDGRVERQDTTTTYDEPPED